MESESNDMQQSAEQPVANNGCGYGSDCGAPNSGCRRCNPAEPPRGKLQCYNYLADIPGGMADFDFVEVQFKNTRKGFYKNSTDIDLCIGDWVAVEAAPGHDIGQVTMTGALVKLQMARAGIKKDAEVRRVFRKAKPADMAKFEEAKARETSTMIRSRKIAESLQLDMKIGDVEYQGDGSKAIFYYIADERVDFRQLIKVLAETFRVRIEMKQIGARQEAGRIGGIGPCGRPLCCSTWMKSFVSVATSAARYQDISLNPQKLAGQCAKLKCCLNFEVDTYVECAKHMPAKEIRLETLDATYYYFKVDIFKREITYSTDKSIAANLVTIDADRAFEVIAMNKRGEKPERLERDGDAPTPESRYNDILDPDNFNRFDKKRKKKSRNKSRDSRPADEPRAEQVAQADAPVEPKQQRNDAPQAADSQQPQQQERSRADRRPNHRHRHRDGDRRDRSQGDSNRGRGDRRQDPQSNNPG